MPEQAACVIFDLDGTLVDSEIVSATVFKEMIPELPLDPPAIMAAYRGLQFARILEDFTDRYGVRLDEDFTPRFRAAAAARFATDLRAYPGVHAALDALPHALCVASNAPLAKIGHALDVTGLADVFGANVFSAYEVGHWKPDPRLFLTAAGAMGVAPEACIVVEDSEVGVAAGLAAGMQVIRFTNGMAGGGEAWGEGARELLHYSALPATIEAMLAGRSRGL